MKHLYKYILVCCILAMASSMSAQLYHTWNSYEYKILKSEINKPENKLFPSIQPQFQSDIFLCIDREDSDIPSDWLKYPLNASFDSSFNRLRGLRFDARPMIMGEFQNHDKLFSYGAGLWLAADYRGKLAIEYKLFYQSFPTSIYNSLIQQNVLNNTMRIKQYRIDSTGIFHDFNLTYKPFDFFKVEAGYGRHFIGDGYRSMMLSCESINYPYLKTELKFWNIKYLFMIAQTRDIPILYPNTWYGWISPSTIKYTAMHYLNWQVSKSFSMGLFEAIVMGPNRGFDIYYINPAVFFRPIEFGLGSVDNALLGINAKLTIVQNYHFYGQLVLDDFNVAMFKDDIKHFLNSDEEGLNYGFFGNKYALQAGFKTYDFAGVRNLNWFVEWNYARPYTYSHHDSKQNYSHYGRPLAHPMGANFKEWIVGVDYLYKRWESELRIISMRVGMDEEDTHNGQDIFQNTMDANQGGNIPVSTYYNITLQGALNVISLADLQLYYHINPESGLKLGLGITAGVHKTEEQPDAKILQWRIGLSSYMYRNYTGF